MAAARRAEALRAVLVRERLALVARPVFERLLVERLVVFERLVLVERLRVVLLLRRALLRLRLLLVFWAIGVAIPPPLAYCGKDINSKDSRKYSREHRFVNSPGARLSCRPHRAGHRPVLALRRGSRGHLDLITRGRGRATGV